MDRLHRRYTAAWAAWALTFATIEVVAIRKDEGGTLSEHLRAALGQRYDSHPVHRVLGIVAIVGAVTWFIPHVVHDTRSPVES